MHISAISDINHIVHLKISYQICILPYFFVNLDVQIREGEQVIFEVCKINNGNISSDIRLLEIRISPEEYISPISCYLF